MKLIPLGKNKYAQIDDADYEIVSKHKWHTDSHGYAVRRYLEYCDHGFYKYRTLALHRFLHPTPSGFAVDHINGNRLDNQRHNLRTVTHQQNQMNKAGNVKAKSGFKGVSLVQGKHWLAYITHNRKRFNIGYFPNPHTAALAYDLWADFFFGEYARLNFQKTINQ